MASRVVDPASKFYNLCLYKRNTILLTAAVIFNKNVFEMPLGAGCVAICNSYM